jgi:hypothetical protein
MAADILRIVHQIQDVDAQVTDLEGQITERTLALVPLYHELVDTCGGSNKAAAKEAKRHGLKYASVGAIGQLLRWGAICAAVQNQGGLNAFNPPTRSMSTAITGAHLSLNAGPEELAALWLSLPAEAQTAKGFAVAALAKWPKPRADPNSSQAIEARLDKIGADFKKFVPATRTMYLPALLAGVRKSDYLATKLAQVIEERWGSLTAFQQAVTKIRNK